MVRRLSSSRWWKALISKVRDDICVSGSHDHSVKVWDLTNGSCLRTLMYVSPLPQVTSTFLDRSRDHTDKVLCVQFNWEYIVSGSTDKTIKVEENSSRNRVPNPLTFRSGVMQTESVCAPYRHTMVQWRVCTSISSKIWLSRAVWITISVFGIYRRVNVVNESIGYPKKVIAEWFERWKPTVGASWAGQMTRLSK